MMNQTNPSWPLWLLSLALLGSLLLNGYLLRHNAPAHAPKAANNRVAASSPSPSGPNQADQASLRRCQELQWKLAAGLVGSMFSHVAVEPQGASPSQSTAPAPQTQDSPTLPFYIEPKPSPKGSKTPTQSSPQETQKMLCEIAQTHLRKHWLRHRKEVTHYLKQSATKKTQEASFKRESETLRRLLPRHARVIQQHQEGFRATYEEYMRSFHKAIQQDPPAWREVRDLALRYFRAKDRWVQETLGDKALHSLKRLKAKDRLALLTLLSLYGQ